MGQTVPINHGLGRAYQGFYVIRAQGGAPALVEAALPAGVGANRMIALTSANAGTYDLLIF